MVNSNNVNSEDLVKENRELKQQVVNLSSQLEWFKRQIFGKKSERVIDIAGNYPELPGFTIPETGIPEPDEEITVPEHSRKSRKGKGEYTLEFPDDLPCEEIIHELPDEKLICPETGKQMVEVSREAVNKLAWRKSECYIKRHVYIKYGVRGAPLSGVVQAPAPPCIIERSKLDASFMAELVVEKYAYHMPLNRIQERLASFGVKVSRQLFSSVIIKLGDTLQPLYDLMIRKIFENGVIFTDDTPVKLIVKGAGKAKKSRMWIYLGGKPNAPPYHVYQFTENWNHDHPKEFLKNFKGTFHSDAYEAYEDIDKNRQDITWAACWSHSRRGFEKALGGGKSPFCLKVLRIIRHLFLYERVAWNRSPEERLKIRQQREKPIINNLFSILHEKLSAGDSLPQEPLTKAILYVLKRKKNFTVYLNDPDIHMHNNFAENALRKICIGKKNWMFVGSLRAGDSAAVLFSLVQTCRAMKINPREYLEDIFTRFLDHPAKKLEELLPDQWMKLRSDS